MSAGDGSGHVILFPKARDEAIKPDVDVKPKSKLSHDGCRHNVQLLLDTEAHQLQCPSCGQVLDPFDWILDYIQKWNYITTRYRQAQQQAAHAEKRLADLERLEKNTKARIRKGGLVITSKGARAAYGTLRALGHAVDAGLRTLEEKHKLEERLSLFSYKPEDARLAFGELHRLCNLEGEPDEKAIVKP